MSIQDIDECQTGAHRCQADATCINTVGGYNCTCNPGYGGDGFNCTGKARNDQDFNVNLALIRAIGISKFFAAKIKLGQISESTKNILSGFH